VTGVFVLSGETATARGVTQRTVFDWSKRTWGAFELVARVNALSIDDAAFPVYATLDASASKATAVGVGLNWYVNRNVKFSTNYEQTRFERGAPDGADRGDEHALFSRFQLAF
jgi:phosphate-selective porin OprO/OprP